MRYNLLRQNQEETENINRPITSTEIKSVIFKRPTNRRLGPGGFTGKCYQTFREELTPILLKLFWKLQRKEHSQAHSTRPPLPWYQNQTEIPQKRKLETNIIDEHRGKSLEQNTSKKKKKSINTLKGSYTLIKWDLPQRCKDFSISTNQSYVINYIKKF